MKWNLKNKLKNEKSAVIMNQALREAPHYVTLCHRAQNELGTTFYIYKIHKK